ncbi:MAG TPA: hypothetical protein VNJ01_04845 [Bacteriovoracaceae bacterium]|nr:hypothetical protein [Bacteriovoracaceae bacterium]
MRASPTWACLILLIIFGSCANHRQQDEVPEAVDIGTLGASGTILLYYRNQGHLYLRVCPVDMALVVNPSPDEIKKSCPRDISKDTQIPLDSFFEKIREHMRPNLKALEKAVIPEEIDEDYQAKMSASQVKTLESELKQFNSFFTTYGAADARTFTKDEILRYQKATSSHHQAFKLISEEVEKTIQNIAAQKSLTLIRSKSKNDIVLYKVFKDFNVTQKKACGLKGPVKERIKDCARYKTSKSGNISLVTRSRKFFEVYKDYKTGALWTDIVNGLYDHTDAVKRCKAGLKEAGLPESVKWKLPSKEDYQKARNSQIRTKWENGDSWTSTTHPKQAMAWAHSDLEDKVQLMSVKEDLKVRCIAY